MKYSILKTAIAAAGNITILLGRNQKIVFDKQGGELTKDQVTALTSAYKSKDGWFKDSTFGKLVASGRLKIEGDKELETLFGSATPRIQPKVRKEMTVEERLAKIEETQKKLDAEYLALKEAQAQNNETGKEGSDAGPGGTNPFAKK